MKPLKAVLVVAGLLAYMHARWYLTDTILCLLFGILILCFRPIQPASA